MKRTPSLTRFLVIVTLCFLFGGSITSCSSTRNLNYFNDLPDSINIQLPPMVDEERVIENGDQLNITFSGKDNAAASFFNRQGANSAIPAEPSATPPPTTPATSTYLVDNFGFLEFPVLGRIKVNGMTASQLKGSLTKTVSAYLKEPIVDVYFATFRVTLLGQVGRTGTFVLPMQRTTLFEALAAGGDLPITARRDDIQLYRDYKGKRTITRFDLRSKNVLTNPQVFQLKHNDVIYVKPRPSAIFREDFGLWASVFSIAIGVISLGFAFTRN